MVWWTAIFEKAGNAIKSFFSSPKGSKRDSNDVQNCSNVVVKKKKGANHCNNGKNLIISDKLCTNNIIIKTVNHNYYHYHQHHHVGIPNSPSPDSTPQDRPSEPRLSIVDQPPEPQPESDSSIPDSLPPYPRNLDAGRKLSGDSFYSARSRLSKYSSDEEMTNSDSNSESDTDIYSDSDSD